MNKTRGLEIERQPPRARPGSDARRGVLMHAAGYRPGAGWDRWEGGSGGPGEVGCRTAAVAQGGCGGKGLGLEGGRYGFWGRGMVVVVVW